MEIPVHIITLTPQAPPVQELKEQLVAQGITAILSSGVDGRKEMPPLQEGESINQHRSLKMRMIELTPSEVGCYLSHYRIIKKAYQSGIPEVCILEDDVLIEKDFKRILQEIEGLPDEVEFMRLMGLKQHKRKLISLLDHTHWLTRPIKGLCGTQGYVINRIGMQKVIEAGASISEPIDKFFDHFWNIPLKSYSIEPHLIWERPRTSSSITKSFKKPSVKSINIRHRRIKLTNSTLRRIYISKNWNHFHPSTKTKIPQGKTQHIRIYKTHRNRS